MYAHPFSADYWRDASREVRDLRKLLFSALMIALCIVLAQVPSVPLLGGAKVTWGFLARSVCAWVCGPVLGLVFACAEDGTVEAVGHRTLPVFAVQWHPERLCGAFARPESADGARLLRALLR